MAENQDKDYRSSETGQYVSEEFAESNKATTQGEERKDSSAKTAEFYASLSDESIENLVIDSEKYYLEYIKPFYENQKLILTEIHKRKGLGYKFQDPKTGAVLKTVQEEYKSVSLFNLGIHRTRFSDEEAKQSLSNKEAEESGFILKFGDRRKKK